MRTLVVLLLLAGAAAAQEPTAEQWLEAGRAEAGVRADWLDVQIANTEQAIDAIQHRCELGSAEIHLQFNFKADGKRTASFTAPNVLAQKTMLASYRRRLIDLKQQRFRAPVWIEPQLRAFAKGQFGYLSDTQSVVSPSVIISDPRQQTRGDKLFLDNLKEELIRPVVLPERCGVVQVIDDSSMLVRFRGQILMLNNVATEGFVDGQSATFSEPMYVTGTATYAAAIGTNTVHTLVPISSEVVRKLTSSIDTTSRPFMPRTWQDISGKFSIEAELADFDGKTVTLRKKDGSKLDVPFSKLSKDDKEYAQEQLGAP